MVVPGHLLCLAHLGASDRIGYLTTLSPGDDIDHRGTTFSSTLLDELLNALSDRATSRPRLGAALFHGAAFATAEFIGATFSSTARFDEVTFSAAAGFEGAEFSAQVGFEEVTFAGIAGFNDATFSADADFSGSLFSTAAQLGPLVCFGRLDLSSTVFAVPVTSEAAAMSVVCVRTRWEATVTLRLRHDTVPIQAGKRWVCEGTHSWMNGFGKLHRCTDRDSKIVGEPATAGTPDPPPAASNEPC